VGDEGRDEETGDREEMDMSEVLLLALLPMLCGAIENIVRLVAVNKELL